MSTLLDRLMSHWNLLKTPLRKLILLSDLHKGAHLKYLFRPKI